MQVKIFGRTDCEACKATKEKFEFFTQRWGVRDATEIVFYDMDTVDGLAESAMHDVGSIPTTIIYDGDRELARWDGVVPESRQFREFFVDGARQG